MASHERCAEHVRRNLIGDGSGTCWARTVLLDSSNSLGLGLVELPLHRESARTHPAADEVGGLTFGRTENDTRLLDQAPRHLTRANPLLKGSLVVAVQRDLSCWFGPAMEKQPNKLYKYRHSPPLH